MLSIQDISSNVKKCKKEANLKKCLKVSSNVKKYQGYILRRRQTSRNIKDISKRR